MTVMALVCGTIAMLLGFMSAYFCGESDNHDAEGAFAILGGFIMLVAAALFFVAGRAW